MDDIYTIRRALRFVHVEPEHNNAIAALERVHALLAAPDAVDPLRHPVSMDAVEAALAQWFKSTKSPILPEGPWSQDLTDRMTRAIAAADAARGRDTEATAPYDRKVK